MSEKSNVSRRQFINSTAAGALAAGATVVPRPANARILGANERIQVGFIGVGGQGGSHVRDYNENRDNWNVRPVAVSEIWETRKQRAKELAGGGADVYHDYQDLLARDDIDAVVIATPDHWHMPMAIDALKAGKHVYLEKPMTRTFKEAKKLHQVWKEVNEKTGLLLQVGTQHSADGRFWAAREAIKNGQIGKAIWSQATYSRNSKGGEWQYTIHDADPGKDGDLDWKAFLGDAPKRKYDPDRYFRWRKYWDYSGGIATDLFYHILAPHHVALGDEFPIRAVSSGGIYQHPNREVPDTHFIVLDYPGDYSILLASSMAQSRGMPNLIRGHEATIEFGSGEIRIVPERIYKDEFQNAHGEVDSIALPAFKRTGHRENFIRAIRGQDDLNCPCDRGYRIMTAIAMGIKAYREQKTIGFDPDRERYTRPPKRPGFGELSRHML